MKKSVFALLLAILLVFCSCAFTSDTQNQINISDSDFAVHFIDVGQADASLIVSGGETMLIDGGNTEDSNVIAAYLKKYNIDYLDYIVCTHAHEDHVGGLSGALATVNAGKVFAPKTESDSKAYSNFKKKVYEKGLDVTNPAPGDKFSLGSADVFILGPIKENEDEVNNTSIVLKITYGDTAFLFTGDAEADEEKDIINAGYDLSADVLKVGHHGSETSSSYIFLREVMPEYAIISVGKDNTYVHPSDNILSRLKDAGANIYRTDLLGDIVVLSDGENIVLSSGGQIIEEKTSEDTEYIGNKKSKKYHAPDCSSLPEAQNRVYFSSKAEAESNSYTPCRQCSE